MPSPVENQTNATPYVPDSNQSNQQQSNSQPPLPGDSDSPISKLINGIGGFLSKNPVSDAFKSMTGIQGPDTSNNPSFTSGKKAAESFYNNAGDYEKESLNHLLFKVPQAVIENVDPSQVNNFRKIEQSPGGKIGAVSGDIGSTFIPVPGLSGIGLAGKGAGLGRQVLGAAINSGANSAGQQTIRELANASAAEPEGRQADISGGNITTAGLTGAALGAIFHTTLGLLAGRGGKPPSGATPEQVASAQKLENGELLNINKTGPNGELIPADQVHPDLQKAADAYVNKISGGQNGPIRDALAGQTPVNQASNIGTQTVNTARVGTKYGILGENTPQELAAANAAIKGKLNQIDEIAQPNLNEIKSVVGNDDALTSAIKITNQIPDQIVQNKVQEQIGKIHEAMMKAGSAGEMRTILNQGLDTMSAQMANDATIRYGYQALQEMKNSFNKTLSDTVASSGHPELSQVPQEYGILQDIGSMSTMQQMSALAAKSGPGSVEKGLGAITQHPTTLLKTVLRPGAKKIDEMATTPFPTAVSNIAKTTPTDGSIPPGGVPPINNGGGSGLPPIQPIINAASKKEPNQAPAGTLQTDLYDESGSDTPAMSRLSNAIEDRFQKQLMQSGQNMFPDIVDQKRKALNSQLFDKDGNPDVLALSNFLFDNEKDKEAFAKAANAYNQMMPNIREAYQSSHGITPTNTFGLSKLNTGIANLLTTMTPNSNAAVAARNSIVQGFQNFTGADNAWNAQEAITNATSPADLEKRLLTSMKSSNSTGYNLLKRAGLVP